MYRNLTKGFAWTLAAGLMMGVNLVPPQSMRIWQWENYWVVQILESLVIAWVRVCLVLLPDLTCLYAAAPETLPHSFTGRPMMAGGQIQEALIRLASVLWRCAGLCNQRTWKKNPPWMTVGLRALWTPPEDRPIVFIGAFQIDTPVSDSDPARTLLCVRKSGIG
jgi:hypothetical protein